MYPKMIYKPPKEVQRFMAMVLPRGYHFTLQSGIQIVELKRGDKVIASYTYELIEDTDFFMQKMLVEKRLHECREEISEADLGTD